MLFYERISAKQREEPTRSTDTETEEQHKYKVELSTELNEWIWQDNMQFLKVSSFMYWSG
jgi:predicted XRE-type DNA-binding protein